jgi:RNA polymerase primary sigma factor
MDAPLNEADDNTLLEVLKSDDDRAPDESLLDDSIKIDVEWALSLLTPREAKITRLYFGIGCEHAMTLEEVGKQFNLTRERVRQIKERALRKLRQKLCCDTLQKYLS